MKGTADVPKCRVPKCRVPMCGCAESEVRRKFRAVCSFFIQKPVARSLESVVCSQKPVALCPSPSIARSVRQPDAAGRRACARMRQCLPRTPTTACRRTSVARSKRTRPIARRVWSTWRCSAPSASTARRRSRHGRGSPDGAGWCRWRRPCWSSPCGLGSQSRSVAGRASDAGVAGQGSGCPEQERAATAARSAGCRRRRGKPRLESRRRSVQTADPERPGPPADAKFDELKPLERRDNDARQKAAAGLHRLCVGSTDGRTGAGKRRSKDGAPLARTSAPTAPPARASACPGGCGQRRSASRRVASDGASPTC